MTDHPSTHGEARSSPLKSLMKWVGIVAAVLSLIAGVRQVLTLTGESAERERRIGELLATGAAQQSAKDYPQAWMSFETALTQAEQGNLLAKLTRRLGERRRQVRVAQEDLAMQWLESIAVPPGQTFASIVDKVLPVLHRGVLEGSGARAGDLYAHVGWGYFLKRRDGPSSLDPAPWYVKALEADSANPYAHAFSGHWKMWNHEPLDAAMGEFAAAIASNRERAFVRGLQVAALVNRGSADARLELVKAANDVRKNDEPMDGRMRRELRVIYHLALNDKPFTQRLITALPVTEQLATIEMVTAGPSSAAGSDDSLSVATALLEEAGGEPARAVKTWRAVRANQSESDSPLARRADAAIKRLAR
ncbi:MAG: hypothetical protein WEG40_18180 [Candidatus Rokuibacteriota bacterium]